MQAFRHRSAFDGFQSFPVAIKLQLLHLFLPVRWTTSELRSDNRSRPRASFHAKFVRFRISSSASCSVRVVIRHHSKSGRSNNTAVLPPGTRSASSVMHSWRLLTNRTNIQLVGLFRLVASVGGLSQPADHKHPYLKYKCNARMEDPTQMSPLFSPLTSLKH